MRSASALDAGQAGKAGSVGARRARAWRATSGRGRACSAVRAGRDRPATLEKSRTKSRNRRRGRAPDAVWTSGTALLVVPITPLLSADPVPARRLAILVAPQRAPVRSQFGPNCLKTGRNLPSIARDLRSALPESYGDCGQTQDARASGRISPASIVPSAIERSREVGGDEFGRLVGRAAAVLPVDC